MSFFAYENKKVYYTKIGSGPPLLLLHGNTASSNMFYGIADRYAADFTVILIDFLGHGQSDRLKEFPADLWFYEAQQVIALLWEKQLGPVNIIGSSGGALVGINVALEAPELVGKLIADSFEGERPLASFTETVEEDREASKREPDGRQFYEFMHGPDWEMVVDQDTSAIVRHQKEIGVFFHKDLKTLKPEILLTASREDEFGLAYGREFFETVYQELISKIGHGQIHLFDTGGHPAILSNQEGFYQLSKAFFKQQAE